MVTHRRGLKKYVVAIDAGTTSVRVVCFDAQLRVVAQAQKTLKQYYPEPGWVEHDPMELWNTTERLLKKVLRGRANAVSSIGITNQRETTVVWNAQTGVPVYNAIVWQCRRTADLCAQLREEGHEKRIKQATGLVCDPYFSATKIRWILDHIRYRPTMDIRFGTIDSWLLWNLTEGVVHATDYTNASRTALFNIRTQQWDAHLLRLLDIPKSILPTVQSSQSFFGTYQGIPITAVAGDQQAALYGQGAWKSGQTKTTYGTGCFLLANTGQRFISSKSGLLTTLAIGSNGDPVFALEGSVFMGGAIVQWLRDQLRLIRRSTDIGTIAATVPDTHGVTFVPAFTGLGAPYWDDKARGIITGLTRGANRAHVLRAAEEAIAFQVADVVDAMQYDMGTPIRSLRVDGGAARDNFLLQFQADILGVSIERSRFVESTAVGAALLAGRMSGLWTSAAAQKLVRQSPTLFAPTLKKAQRQQKIKMWHRAVQQARTTS